MCAGSPSQGWLAAPRTLLSEERPYRLVLCCRGEGAIQEGVLPPCASIDAACWWPSRFLGPTSNKSLVNPRRQHMYEMLRRYTSAFVAVAACLFLICAVGGAGHGDTHTLLLLNSAALVVLCLVCWCSLSLPLASGLDGGRAGGLPADLLRASKEDQCQCGVDRCRAAARWHIAVAHT